MKGLLWLCAVLWSSAALAYQSYNPELSTQYAGLSQTQGISQVSLQADIHGAVNNELSVDWQHLASYFGLRWSAQGEHLWSGEIQGYSNLDGSTNDLHQAALLLSVACMADQKALAENAGGWYLRLEGAGSGFADPARFKLLLIDQEELSSLETFREQQLWGARYRSGVFKADCQNGLTAND